MARGASTLLLNLRANASQALSEMDKVESKSEGMSTGVKAAGTAAGIAVAAGISKGVSAFAEFDTQMREVYTLMPGISQEAMDELSTDVRDMALEYGVATTEIVPALYQAISAGVPPDNVMTFMETAAKTARGGVTDLTTSVDGLTSVVNAYGEDVITAQEAADIMFTGVRLGKTDMEQLSSSLFQVVPVASQLGVGFEEVTAALATMTAQGTPTRVAATQLRGALVELSKEGSIAFEHFQTATGQTFPDFIAGGGTVAEAMILMGDHAEGLDTPMSNMFGSIEGAMGASALASETGALKMGESMDAMTLKAGSVDVAFETMAGGVGFQMDQMGTAVDELFLTLGETLAPAVTAIIDALIPVAEALAPAFESVGELIAALVPIIETVIVAVGPLIEIVVGLVDLVAGVVGTFTSMFDEVSMGAAIVDEMTVALGYADDEIQRLIGSSSGMEREVGHRMREAKDDALELEAALGFAAVANESMAGTVSFLAGTLDEVFTPEHTRDLDLYWKATDRLDVSLGDAASATDILKAAEQELRDSRRAAVDPLFALIDAEQRRAEAMLTLAELTEAGAMGTPEYTDALADLADAVWDTGDALGLLDPVSAVAAIEDLALATGLPIAAFDELLRWMAAFNLFEMEPKDIRFRYTTSGAEIPSSFTPAVGSFLPAGAEGAALAGRSGPQVVVNVAGSVVTERDIAESVERILTGTQSDGASVLGN